MRVRFITPEELRIQKKAILLTMSKSYELISPLRMRIFVHIGAAQNIISRQSRNRCCLM